MHDAMDLIKIIEATQDSFCDFAENIHSNRAKIFGNAVQGTMALLNQLRAKGTYAHPQSIYSIHMTTSPELCKNAP